ncbi:GreA/GreB family elongation factor [Sphingomonas aerophila]|uniref:Transcription elongation GreA/GreB family factor n=1 Tax=Sphingomonas aerophila TaxID=1344948 RepID=A0A7W9BDR8_9SPHN|nr:GreA/GreB family elongation factor [Sphingomonas aerophila]MBB5715389.1 transcription elongation GreA/GreB family factor [Sphingomonas aerophila]
MSVAFRRDSDEEHLEPKFERPIAPGPNLVTPRGLEMIGAEVARLEAAIANAPAEDIEALRRDLRYWHTRATTAELAPRPEEGEAGIGSRVTFQQGATTRTVEIVGGDEADPASGRVGFQAPLARALMGAMEGEAVASGGATLQVLAVE